MGDSLSITVKCFDCRRVLDQMDIEQSGTEIDIYVEPCPRCTTKE